MKVTPLPLKDIFGIEIPCLPYNMTVEQTAEYIKTLREKAHHDNDYCLDDPGGSLQREVDKMFETASNLENMLLRRENAALKKELEKYGNGS